MRHDRFSSNMTNEYDWAQDTAPSRQSDLTALRVITVPAACPLLAHLNAPVPDHLVPGPLSPVAGSFGPAPVGGCAFFFFSHPNSDSLSLSPGSEPCRLVGEA